MTFLKSSFIGLVNLLALAIGSSAFGQAVTLDVSFKLTDIDYKPLPGVPVRLVFACDKDWQSPKSGYRFQTDDKGEAHLTANVTLDKRLRRIPTNFVDSLLSTPKPMDHLSMGAELSYMDFPALYMVDVLLLPDRSTAMQDSFFLYTADQSGNFSHKVWPREYHSVRPDLKNVVLRGPGFEPWDYMLQPVPDDATGRKWALKLAFKKTPPPIPL